MSPEYCNFLRKHEGTVFTTVPVDEIKNYQVLPFDQLSAEFGDFHWTSSVAWMIAMAILQKPKAIGLWGVDMAAQEEYHSQRPGCQHFLGIAMQRGIDVIIPPESDLMRPPPPYGFIEYNPRFVKMLARQRELTIRLENSNMMIQRESGQVQFLNGALDDLNYMINTYAYEGSNDLRFAISDARSAKANLAMHSKAIEISEGRTDVSPEQQALDILLASDEYPEDLKNVLRQMEAHIDPEPPQSNVSDAELAEKLSVALEEEPLASNPEPETGNDIPHEGQSDPTGIEDW